MKLEIYDPPMCCSSGVCGPNINPELVRFSSDLDWLKGQNVEVERFGLSSNPAAFTCHELVKEALKKEGNECLPLILANGILVSKGKYPSRDELSSFSGIKSNETLFVKENKMEKSESNVVACGPECDCSKPAGNKKFKVVACLVVLLAVVGIFVAVGEEISEQPVEEKNSVGKFLDSLASLNTVAVNQDSVFVFLPAKESVVISKDTTDVIASAEQKIEKAAGIKIGLYTLKSDSPDYANIAAQLSLPGMLVMSKGRGMGTVSGGITEDKIMQAYVASARAGGCGPSGCGSGCN